MRHRRIKIGLLFAGIAVLVTVGVVGSVVKPPREPDRRIVARFGDVEWNHELHARLKDIATCQVCHHQERPGTTEPRPCRHCHKDQSNQNAVILADLHIKNTEKPVYKGENGPPAMTAFHGRCVGCHKAMVKGPVACRDCHA